MAYKRAKSYFWASYADLMTSLFFDMLMLFVVAIVELNSEKRRIKEQYDATKGQLEKIKEIETATQNLDGTYFEYKKEYKKHRLLIDVQFPKQKSDINLVSLETRQRLLEAGKSIEGFVKKTVEHNPNIQYLLIIEGQASRDPYTRNYELSYERALSLKRYWEKNGILFSADNCEVLICGSGDGVLSGTGLMREEVESKNQRFLIHLLPKSGMIEEVTKQ